MNITIDLVLLICGFICFLLATFGVGAKIKNINLVALGLAFWILTAII